MNQEIEKIRLSDLEGFVKNQDFGQFTVIPITELRVKSYINNPHALPDDVVLYLGFVNKQLVAFRSLFAGIIQSENENIRFAWCSGNWVHPDFRRKGFSEQLLNEAFNDWNGKLMFTNYAPNSEQLYLKSGKFKAIHHYNGFRGYLFPKTRKLVSVANKNALTKFIFSIADYVVSFVSNFRLLFFSKTENPEFRFEINQFPDKECYSIIRNSSAKFLFNRGEGELKWIFANPWISGDENTASKKYPFSSHSGSFNYNTIKIFIKNKLAGFFIFSVREGHLKTLHFNIPNGIESEVANFLKLFCAEHKIEVITVYKNEVAQQLFAQKFPFLHAKKYGQKIYSSFEIKHTGNFKFQDGEGDVIFT